MTLTDYVAEVNSLISPHLSSGEINWATNAWASGIAAKRFAGWLALTASYPSPLIPDPPSCTLPPVDTGTAALPVAATPPPYSTSCTVRDS